MIEIIPALAEHARPLAANLRHADCCEVQLIGMTPLECVRASIHWSMEAWTALEDGAPIACWGIVATSLLGQVGYPWLLTTPGVERNRVRFLRENRAWLDHALEIFPRLEAVVDARYTRAHRWLRKLGFTIHYDEPFCMAELEA